VADVTTTRFGIVLTLLDDVVLSAVSATTGPHKTLRYVPGAKLLGHAAARLYDRARKEKWAYQAFHSGDVRFSDGLPLADDGRVGWPMPLSLHRPKEGGDIVDLSQHARGQVQWTQERGAAIDSTGTPVQLVRTEYTLRSAKGSGRGAAPRGMLFGYESLPAGARFFATIEGPSDILTKIRPVFDRTTLRVGRSRFTEHGRIGSIVIEEFPQELPTSPSANRVTVWALSDLCLSDQHGQPTLGPCRTHFGFPAGEVDWDRTFIRSRQYAPINAALNAHLPERVVIERGSVITFRGCSAIGGLLYVGAWREVGLGRCAVNALPLPKGKDAARAADLAAAASVVSGSDPAQEDGGAGKAFLDWLRRRQASPIEAEAWAMQAAATLLPLYEAVRLLNGIDPSEPAGPTPSQWGRVLEAARTAGGVEELRNVLFARREVPANQGICTDAVWTRRFGSDPDDNLAGWMKARIKDAVNQGLPPQAIALLAREARRLAAQLARAQGRGR
jgi:hypothetical protein